MSRPLTLEQARAQLCRRDLSGGLMFGMDWPTLRAVFPDRYHELHLLRYWSAFLPD